MPAATATDVSLSDVSPGRDAATVAVTRGATRLLVDHGLAPLAEFDLPNGRRADVFAIARDGEITIVEVKSGVEDFRVDAKWPEYRDYCDRFFFAVDARFPQDLIPEDAGLVVADAFGGAIVRAAPAHKLPPARRKALTLRAARSAAFRLARDVGAPDGRGSPSGTV